MPSPDRLLLALRIASVSLLAAIALLLYQITSTLNATIVTATTFRDAASKEDKERLSLSIPFVFVRGVSGTVEVDGSVRVDNLYEIER